MDKPLNLDPTKIHDAVIDHDDPFGPDFELVRYDLIMGNDYMGYTHQQWTKEGGMKTISQTPGRKGFPWKLD